MKRISHEEFIQRMELHLKEHFPSLFENCTQSQLREFIVRNWQFASGYGLTSELGICNYLEAASLLGEDFPSTKSWARPLLEQECSEAAKLEELNEQFLATAYPTGPV